MLDCWNILFTGNFWGEIFVMNMHILWLGQCWLKKEILHINSHYFSPSDAIRDSTVNKKLIRVVAGGNASWLYSSLSSLMVRHTWYYSVLREAIIANHNCICMFFLLFRMLSFFMKAILLMPLTLVFPCKSQLNPL